MELELEIPFKDIKTYLVLVFENWFFFKKKIKRIKENTKNIFDSHSYFFVLKTNKTLNSYNNNRVL